MPALRSTVQLQLRRYNELTKIICPGCGYKVVSAVHWRCRTCNARGCYTCIVRCCAGGNSRS